MTIDEAIKVNESLLDGTYYHRDEDMEDGLRLGIEALKAVRRYRQSGIPPSGWTLPGETKD